MSPTLSAKRLTIAAVALVATATGGVAYAASTAVGSTTKDVVASTSGGRSLSTTGGALTTILSATLPAGPWVLTAHATMVNWGPSDYTRCMVFAGGTNLGGATATVGNPSAGSAGAASLVSTVSFAKGVSLSSPTTVSVQCAHDSSNGASPSIDGGASLVAHRSAALVTLLQ